MGGPQAMLGWILGALIVICDGLVWAELGAALPDSGGSYRYLKMIYDPERLGKLMAFLFIWQLTFSAPLSIASGSIGLAQYAGFVFPGLMKTIWQTNLGLLNASITVTPATFVAMGTCLLAVLLLYRNVSIIGRISEYLWVGVMLTIAWIIVSGVTHFDSQRAFDFPQGAFTLSSSFFKGLGAAMLIAGYDYWGYHAVCFVGGETREPGKTIPRAILYSILLVAVIYIVMNISILGAIPWRELGETANSDARRYIISVFMQRLYGNWAGYLATLLIIWTAFSSVFSLLLAYSRVRGRRRRLLQIVRACASGTPVSKRIPACIGRARRSLLFIQAAGCDCGVGGDPTDDSVSRPDRRCDGVSHSKTGFSASIPDVVLSVAGACRALRLSIRPHHAQRLHEGNPLRGRHFNPGYHRFLCHKKAQNSQNGFVILVR